MGLPLGLRLCIFTGGFLSNGLLTLTLPVPVMLREIGTTYGGSAGGIVSLLQTAGSFFIPTFAIALIAASSPADGSELAGAVKPAGLH